MRDLDHGSAHRVASGHSRAAPRQHERRRRSGCRTARASRGRRPQLV